ncbi:MAG: Lrp/AsnC family transcriptional regulator [Thermomicrobiales bacterium]|nr:Lrp/AsnC family transcriptional regulator [Thermomicrobiales bacterium]
MTPTDRAIIRLLQQNSRASYAELSRKTGIPESTIRRRMERLQETGVIEFSMVADPVKLGYQLRAVIGLKVDVRDLETIAETVRDMEEVAFAAFVTGSFDIIIHVVVEHQEGLVLLLQRLAGIEGIRSTETFVMPWVIKPTTAWVLPHSEYDVPQPRRKRGPEFDEHGNIIPRKRGRPRRNPAT